MNIKRNIIFSLESRKKNGVVVTDNVPVRMRVVYGGNRIDVAKWDADKQRVKKRLHKQTQTERIGNQCRFAHVLYRYSEYLQGI